MSCFNVMYCTILFVLYSTPEANIKQITLTKVLYLTIIMSKSVEGKHLSYPTQCYIKAMIWPLYQGCNKTYQYILRSCNDYFISRPHYDLSISRSYHDLPTPPNIQYMKNPSLYSSLVSPHLSIKPPFSKHISASFTSLRVSDL